MIDLGSVVVQAVNLWAENKLANKQNLWKPLSSLKEKNLLALFVIVHIATMTVIFSLPSVVTHKIYWKIGGDETYLDTVN